MTQIAGRDVPTPELALIAAGAVGVVNLFLPWYRVEVFSVSASFSAFDAGFLAWASALLVVVVGGLTAAKVFAGRALPGNAQIGPNALILALAGLAVLLAVLRLLTETNATYLGLYLGIALAAVQVFFALTLFRASGEKTPDFGRGRPAA